MAARRMLLASRRQVSAVARRAPRVLVRAAGGPGRARPLVRPLPPLVALSEHLRE